MAHGSGGFGMLRAWAGVYKLDELQVLMVID
jgi:hypothetical protein